MAGVVMALREPQRVSCSTGATFVATEAGRTEHGLVIGLFVVMDGGPPLFAHRLMAMLPEAQEAFARRVQAGTRTPMEEVLLLLPTFTAMVEDELRKGPAAPASPSPAGQETGETPWRSIIRPLSEVLAEPETLTDWLVEDLVPAGWVGMLAGETKVGKTLLTLEIARAVATGGQVLGHQARKGAVLLALVDDPPALSRKRLREKLADCGDLVYVRIDRWKAEVATALDQAIAELSPSLVVIDTLVKTVSSIQGDENDAAVMDRIVERFTKWTENLQTTVLLLHHLNKAGTVRGSTAITGAAPFVLTLRKPGEDLGDMAGPDGRPGRFVQLAIDWKLEPVEPVLLAQSGGSFVVMGTTAQAADTSTRRRMTQALGDRPGGVTTPALAREVGQRDEDVRRLLQDMERDGEVARVKGKTGQRGQPAVLWCLAQDGTAAESLTTPTAGATDDGASEDLRLFTQHTWAEDHPREAAIVRDLGVLLGQAADVGSLESQFEEIQTGKRWRTLSAEAQQRVRAAYSECQGRLATGREAAG